MPLVTFKYVNDSRRTSMLGVNDFEDANVKLVKPGQIITFELDVDENSVVLLRSSREKERVLVQIIPKRD